MFLKCDNSTNKIRQMTTNATAKCVDDEEEKKERANTLSNNLKMRQTVSEIGSRQEKNA